MAGAYRLAQAYVEIVPSMKGVGKAIQAAFEGPAKTTGRQAGATAGGTFSGALSDTIGGAVSKTVSAAGSALAGIGKAGLAASSLALPAIGMIGKSALDAYAEWEQAVGGVDTLFKDASKTVQRYAADAYRTAGVSASQYMNQVTSFAASLVSSLGGDTAKAAEYGNQALVDMSDNANKMGTDLESLQFAYQGFAKQNYTMLDNLKLGYGGTQEEMKRLIKDANSLPKVLKDGNDLSIDSFADVVEAISRVQRHLGIMGTTEAEAASTIEGSIGSMRAAWSNWLTELGKDEADIAGLTSRLVGSVVTVAGNVVPRLKEIAEGALQGVGAALGDLAQRLPEPFRQTLPFVQTLADGLSAGSIGLQDIARSAMLAVGAFAGMSAVGGNIDAILGAFETFGGMGDAIAGGLTEARGALSGAMGLFDALGSRWGTATGLIDQQLGGVFGLMSNRVRDGVGDVGSTLVGVFDSKVYVPMRQGLSGIGSKIAAPFQTAFQTVSGRVGGFLQPVTSAFGTAFQGFGSTLAGPIQSGLEQVGGLISGFLQPAGFMKYFGIAAIAGALIAALGALDQSVGGQIGTMISAFMTTRLPGYIAQFQAWATGQLPTLMQTGLTLLTGLIQGITANAGAIIGAAATILTTLVNGIATALPTLIPAAATLVTTIVQGLAENLPQIIESGLTLLAGLVEGIVNAIPQLVAALPQIITSFVDGIAAMLPRILATGVDLLLRLVQGIIDAIPQLVAAIPLIITGFVSTIGAHGGEIIEAGLTMLGKLVIGILKAIPDLLATVGGIPGQILGSLGNVGSLLYNAGASILQGFLRGLKSVWNDVTGFVGNIASWIADHKGPIGYDRRLLIPAGKAIMGGLRRGLSAGWEDVQDDVDGMTDMLADWKIPVNARAGMPALAELPPSAITTAPTPRPGGVPSPTWAAPTTVYNITIDGTSRRLDSRQESLLDEFVESFGVTVTTRA